MTPQPLARYVHAIRTALWNDGAAVMVGSGFSRNAAPSSLNARPFPTWREITDRLFNELHPQGTAGANPDDRVRATATSEALQLAERYQATFGRQQLEDLIQELVPDRDYGPGELHRHLLRLPWADVLTTNYDTLLERAADEVYQRRYDVVRTVADIPRSTRPRIVKLHGSFPSHRPYIVTFEDFRTYPRAFAGFVNLAQQAAMENVLCLVGFSGDDPNFLEWTGWVRDHLRADAPRIYLCNVLDIDETTRSLLDRRNVTPVDLAQLFPRDRYPDPSTRHRLATDWFLRSLSAGRPRSPLSWPEPRPVEATAGSPAPLETAEPAPKEVIATVNSEADLLALRGDWRLNRSLYPGWVIAPEAIRQSVWHAVRKHDDAILRFLPKLSPWQQLSVLSELNWLLDVCLSPLWEEFRPLYQTCLDAFNPFPIEFGERPKATVIFGRDAPPDGTSWVSARQDWLDLALSLLRHFREERRDGEFDELATLIRKVSDLSTDRLAFVQHQRCLFAVERLDDAGCRTALAQWPRDTADPMWAVRRAAVLAELGDIEPARQLVTATLASIRAGSRVGPGQIRTLSREGWAMHLAGNLAWDPGHPDGARRAERDLRWQELEPLGCNPLSVLRAFDGVRDDATPSFLPARHDRVRFQPGRVNVTHAGQDIFARILPAYQAVRMAEEAGYPATCGNARFGHSLLVDAAVWMLPHDPVRTQSIMIRLRDEKLVERYLSRHRVAALPPDTVLSFADLADRSLQRDLAGGGPLDARDHSPEVRRTRERIETAVGVLARVVIRLPLVRVAPLWETAYALYSSPYVRGSISFPDEVRELFESLIQSSERTVLEQQLGPLISLPISGTADMPTPSRRLPDFLDSFGERVGSLAVKLPQPTLRVVVDKLFDVLRRGGAEPRQVAAGRLLQLREYGLLTSKELRQLSAVFWNSVQGDDRLPDDWQFYRWVWLTLPSPKGTSVVRRFRKHTLPAVPDSTNSPLDEDMLRGWLVAPQLGATARRRFGSTIKWNASDASQMLAHIRHWWVTVGRSKLNAKKNAHPLAIWAGGDPRQFHKDVMAVFAQVIIPRVGKNARLRTDVVALVNEMEAAGVAVGDVLPWMDALCPTDGYDDKLRHLLSDPDRVHAVSAARGLCEWVRETSAADTPVRALLRSVPGDLISELGHLVASRKWPGLETALSAAESVLATPVGTTNDGFVRSVLTGLEHLFDETEYTLDDFPRAGTIPYDFVPWCRTLAARVVMRLKNLKKDPYPAVKKWLARIEQDPLPEVRHLIADG